MLTDLYSLVENVIASSFIIGGLAIAINSNIVRSMFDSFTDIEKNSTLTHLTAWMFLILGLIIVWVHNDWYMDHSLIITVFGWIVVIKSSSWLLIPKLMIRLSKKMAFIVLNRWFHIVYGLLLVLIGLFILIRQYMDKLSA